MTCSHSIDDGAYVLGALSTADRAAFDSHLSTCAACRESVASLAVIPGLLGRLGPDAPAILEDLERAPAPSLLPRALAAAASERRRARRVRRLRGLAGVLAAACLALFVGVGVYLVQRPDPLPLTAMQPVGVTNGAVTAEVGLAGQRYGTRVDMRCRYRQYTDGQEHRPWPVHLVVVPRHGEPEQIGVWMAEGGQELDLSGVTRYAPEAIASVELRRANGDPLLRWAPA